MAVRTYSLKQSKNLKLSNNFKVSEFKCKDGSDTILIDDELIFLLQNIRDHFGKAVVVNSGYRSPAYNTKIGGAKKSQHLLGTAADIVVKGVKPEEVAKYAEYVLDNKGGIGLYPSFTHVDVRSNRARWKDFGTEISVSGFFGYNATEPAKYHIEGITHIVEVSPENIKAVETQCSTKSIAQNNFVNGTYFWYMPDGKRYPVGIIVDEGKVISNIQTHDKPVATLIIYNDNSVAMKYVSDITKEQNVRFAMSGYGIYPKITATQEGFVGAYSDVTRTTNRPIIGYRKKDNKVVIAVRSSSSASRANTTAKNLKLDFAISLDGGGSTTLKVNGKYKFKGDGRKIFGGITWE